MLENLFTNVFGRSKAKGRNSQSDASGQSSGSSQSQLPQMPQPPSLPYPPAPYPGAHNQQPASYYPSLPFSQPPSMPTPYGGSGGPSGGHAVSPGYGTLAPSQISPLDSVPFEMTMQVDNQKNLYTLDSIFKEIKRAGDVVDRVDAYLRSNQSDYDFKTEQGLIYE